MKKKIEIWTKYKEEHTTISLGLETCFINHHVFVNNFQIVVIYYK